MRNAKNVLSLKRRAANKLLFSSPHSLAEL